MRQCGSAAMRQCRKRGRALPACAETLGVTAGAPLRMARLPTLPHFRIGKLPHCQIAALFTQPRHNRRFRRLSIVLGPEHLAPAVGIIDKALTAEIDRPLDIGRVPQSINLTGQ